MCVGIPMRVERVDGLAALCSADGRAETVDLALVPDAKAGDEILVFLGLARRRLDREEAARIRAALGSLAALTQGSAMEAESAIQHGFADLIEREPSLPPHLAAAFAAGLKEA